MSKKNNKKGLVPIIAAVGCGGTLLGAVVLAGMVALGVFASHNEERMPGGQGLTGIDAGVREGVCVGALYPRINDEDAFARAIDEFIKESEPKSPLRGMGDSFVDGGKKSGISPAFVASIARKESSLGTAGIATRGTKNSFGRTATARQPHIFIGDRRWYRWSSWRASLSSTEEDDQPSFIKRRYIDEGYKTISDIVHKYAPPSENNTEAYIQQIYSYIEEINQKALKINPNAISCN